MDLRFLYEAEFESLVFASRADSVLDIGCGQGDFLRRAAARGVLAVGVDTDIQRVETASATGLTVRQASADVLPFDDRSFDCAVCERSAHHFPDLAAGLYEALRVSRTCVFIFEPWFDETITSQAQAAELDRWLKRVDTAQGHVNRGPLKPSDFLPALKDMDGIEFDMTQRLILNTVSLESVLKNANARLEGWRDAEPYRRELCELTARLGERGLSEAGAMFVCLRRTIFA